MDVQAKKQKTKHPKGKDFRGYLVELRRKLKLPWARGPAAKYIMENATRYKVRYRYRKPFTDEPWRINDIFTVATSLDSAKRRVVSFLSTARRLEVEVLRVWKMEPEHAVGDGKVVSQSEYDAMVEKELSDLAPGDVEEIARDMNIWIPPKGEN